MTRDVILDHRVLSRASLSLIRMTYVSMTKLAGRGSSMLLRRARSLPWGGPWRGGSERRGGGREEDWVGLVGTSKVEEGEIEGESEGLLKKECLAVVSAVGLAEGVCFV